MTLADAAPRVTGFPACPCGFALWVPLVRLRVSTAGLYDDARFPGRCLLSLDEHYEDLFDVPTDVLALYLEDLRDLCGAVRAATGVAKINYAVLGNAEPHVHWHVVPRRPGHEPLPDRSPWQDPRPVTPLGGARRTALVAALRLHLCASSGAAPSDTAAAASVAVPGRD